MVGLDLVQISQIEASLRRFGERFVRRVFTDRERRYCEAQPQVTAERLAARFAAKEAAFKVLRPGHSDPGMGWRSIEIRRAAAGWTELELHDEALRRAQAQGLSGFGLSMSHEGDYATAVVIATRSRVRCVRGRSAKRAAAAPRPPEQPGNQVAMTEQIRNILREHGRLMVNIDAVDDDGDLYKAGMTSQANVNVMLALESAFDVEFPDRLLKRSVFASVAAIRAAMEELTGRGGP